MSDTALSTEKLPDRPLSAVPAHRTSPENPTVPSAAADVTLGSWQRMLLPFMMAMVGLVTVFFLVVTLFQLNALQARIDNPPRLDLAPSLSVLDESPASAGERLLFAQWRTLANLEQHALERRYHQANVLLMSRTWTRYLGFVTGMMMALVGAAFILGKLREEASSVSVQGKAVEANLSTTSPGLALCFLGTVLMITTLLSHNAIETRDANPLYTRTLFAPQGAEAPPPDPIVPVDPLDPGAPLSPADPEVR
jgi:hypothetical protein